MIRLVHLPSIVTSRGRRIMDVPARPTVGETVEAAAGPGPWGYIVHGRRVSADEPAHDGDEIVAVRTPEGFIFAFIIFAVISAVVSAGIGFLISLLLGPRTPPNTGGGQDGGSATYNWTGIRNTTVNGTPIPVTYGEHRVGGQIIALYRRNASAASTDINLHMVISLGYGPLQAIGEYEQDMGLLAPSGAGVSDDFDRAAPEDLSADSRYTLLSGNPAAIRADVSASGEANFDPTKAGLYEVINTRGALAQNWFFQFKAVFTAGQQSGHFCGNLQDINNYHGARIDTGGTLHVFKKVAGTITDLFTFASIANGDYVRVERFQDCLYVYAKAGGPPEPPANLLGTANADAANLSGFSRGGFNGIVQATGFFNFDDYQFGAARGLPAGMQINGNDANTFNQIKAEIRLGHDLQSNLGADFDRVVLAYQPAITLTPQWTTVPVHAPVEAFHLVLDFPKGLYDQSGGGGVSNRDVIVEVQLSEDGGAFAHITGSPFTFSGARVSPFSRTIFADGPFTGANQVIRLRRRSAEPVSNLIGDTVVLADVNEVEREDVQTYGGYAVVGLQIKATEQLAGGTPTVTFLARGMQVPHWDNTSSVAEPHLIYQWSQNPADVAIDILLNKRYGLGNWVTLADLDIEAFDAWRTYCSETLQYNDYLDEPRAVADSTEAINSGATTVTLTDAAEAADFAAGDYCRVQHEPVNTILSKTALGDGRTRFVLYAAALESYPPGWLFQKIDLEQPCSSPNPVITDTRHTFNGVFDGQLSAWEALIRVCRAGRAMPVKIGNRWSIRIEREAAAVQHINEANMLAGSMEITYVGSAERVDIVEAQYLDAAMDFGQDVVQAGGNPPDSVAKEPIKQTAQLYGITSRREARREAAYQLLAGRLLQKRLKFAMTLDGLAAEQGDVITIGATMPQWSHWTGRVTGTPAAIRVDHQVILSAGTTYVALIRTPQVRAPSSLLTITSPPGTYPAGATLTTIGSASQQIVDALCTIGTTAMSKTEWRIVGTTLRRDLTVEIDAVQYRPEIYALQAPPPCLCALPSDNIYDPNCTFFKPHDCPACDTGCGSCNCRVCSCECLVTGAGAGQIVVESCGCCGVQFKVLSGGTPGQAFTITCEMSVEDFSNEGHPECNCLQLYEQQPGCHFLLPIHICETTVVISGTLGP